MPFSSKDSLVLNRQNKVQRLVIPFSILGHATPASVTFPSNDEPALLFLKTEGVDKITAALDSADGTPSFTSAHDVNGITNIMVDVGEAVQKVMYAFVQRRDAVNKVYQCSLADTDGITAGGEKIVLNVDTDLSLGAANTLDAVLVVEYVISE